MKISKASGFTLVEMLVVITILAVVGGILTEVFVRTLRANNKSQVLSIVKQNGQNTLELIDKAVRNSEEVICPVSSDTASSVLVISKVSETTNQSELFRFTYIPPTASTNGYLTQDMPVAGFTQANCGDIVAITPKLTDDTAQTGVSVSALEAGGPFKRNITPGLKDTVAIRFTVQPGVQSPKAVTGQIDPVEFKTIVVLR